jgi:hypothetical protein
MKRHLFVLPGDMELSLFNEEFKEEIYQTCVGLHEMGLYKYPYDEFSIKIDHSKPKNSILPFDYPDQLTYVVDYEIDKNNQAIITHLLIDDDLEENREHYPNIQAYCDKATASMAKKPELVAELGMGADKFNEITKAVMNALPSVLICFLATKNAVKTTTRNRLAKFGIGKQKAEYVTTITIGARYDSSGQHIDTKTHKRAHFRRGHIRRQHHGPNNSLEKKIWIDPIFVNADQEYVPRAAYKIQKEKVQ